MQSEDSQETLILCSMKTSVPFYTLPKGKKHDKQLPLMSVLLIQISIHAGNHMIIVVG